MNKFDTALLLSHGKTIDHVEFIDHECDMGDECECDYSMGWIEFHFTDGTKLNIGFNTNDYDYDGMVLKC